MEFITDKVCVCAEREKKAITKLESVKASEEQ